ncbi:MAG: MFS transporter [Chloroflexi bacterium]|nr:MFS transporter [Chloroflexota bacterium]
MQRPHSRIRTLFGQRDFRLLVTSNILTQLGQWTQQVGRGWLIYELSHSAFQLGLVSFFSGAAMFLAAPIGGVLSDRLDRRKVVLATQLSLAITAITLAILVETNAVRFWHLYVTAIATGVSVSVNGPTRNAMVHDLVEPENLTSAVTVNSLSMNAMRVLGPAMGGVLIGFLGTESTFWLQAGCCILAMTQVAQIGRRQKAPEPSKTGVLKSLTGSIADGLTYIRRDPFLWPLMVIAFITGLLGLGFLQLMPAYVGEVLDSDNPRKLGSLLMAEGIGAVLGAFFATVTSGIQKRGRMLLILVAVYGVCLALLGLISNFFGAMAMLLALGGLASLMLTNNNVLIQLYVSEQYRGRVFSIYFMNFSLAPLGTLVAGSLTKAVSLQTTFIILGALVTLAAVVIGGRYPRLRTG